MNKNGILLAIVGFFLLTHQSLSAQQRQANRRLGSLGPAFQKMTMTSDRVKLPMTLASTQILVDDVYVNGEGPFRFMLDTGGMGAGRVDSSLVEKLKLKPIGKVTAGDGTQRSGRDMQMLELESLELNGIKFEGVRVLTRDYNQHGAVVRGHIDGILGFALFQKLLLTIDYSKRQLTIERGALPEPNGRDVLASQGEGVAIVDVEIAGHQHQAYLDTGAMGWISVSEKVASKLEFTDEPEQIGEARTLTGAFPIKRGQLKGNVKLGGLEITQPYIVIGQPLRHVNFGGFILRDFVVTYDQANRRIKVTPAEPTRPSGAPTFSRLGRKPTVVQMDTTSGHPLIEASINGKGPYKFILDTGADAVILNNELAAEIGLKPTGNTKIGDPSAPTAVAAETFQVDNITVGDARFENVRAIGWKGLGRPEIQGVIGINLFYDALVELDYPAQQFTVRRGALGPHQGSAYYLDGGSFLTVDLKFGSKTLKTHIDTGNMGQIALPLSMAGDLKLKSKPKVVGRARSISGVFDIHQAELDGAISFAGQSIENPTIHFNDRFDWANMGSKTLADFVVTIDQVNRRFQVVRPD